MAWMSDRDGRSQRNNSACPAGKLLLAALSLTLALVNTGCNRGFYRRTADRDAYSIVAEKGAGPTWSVQPGFSIEPDQRSRFFDPTCPTDPRLPIPAPQLYNYDLPPLATPSAKPRDWQASSTDDLLTRPPSEGAATGDDGLAPSPQPETTLPTPESIPLPRQSSTAPSSISPAQADVRSADAIGGASGVVWRRPDGTPLASGEVHLASAQAESLMAPATPLLLNVQARGSAAEGLLPVNDETTVSDGVNSSETVPPLELLESFGQESINTLPPMPERAWSSLPPGCLRRMLEFDVVRVEYVRTFEREVTAAQLDSAERVNLENILEIALINSREYQTRKELLYRTALRLSLRRFDYELRFLPRGNGIDVTNTRSRAGGVEVNQLAVGSGIGITKSLYTAGDLVARFANDVVLTFNGPTGFSSSVGSAILIDITQPLIQRDIQFEALTQAERDVVYAARDFVRFRKLLFRDLAAQHYNLLLTYRSIAINTQDYFSNLDGFNRADAYERVGQLPRFQVDQFEQNVLRSRGNLINSCNSLEQAIDRLKLRIGLPPEMPLNLDLSELEELTLRDEATVIRDQIRRKRQFAAQAAERSGAAGAIPAAAEVTRRMLNLAKIQQQLEQASAEDVRTLEILVARLEAEEWRLKAKESEQVLRENEAAEASILEAALYLRNLEVIETTLAAIQYELRLRRMLSGETSEGTGAEAEPVMQDATDADTLALVFQWKEKVVDYEQLPSSVELAGVLLQVPYAQQGERLKELVAEAQQLLQEIQQFEQAVVRGLREQEVSLADSESELALLTNQVIEASREGLITSSTGLPELEVDMDAAMLTALVQRLDLMNQRGALADDWRQIKYAGDSLRSILNLRASQSIRTRGGSSNPFDFSFDDSTTTLGLEFDTPLNRRVERNNYRNSLIDYNAGLRNLIEAQDNVKLEIRNDLRAIELDRNQYDIAIASAALAYERVVSTRLQLATGRGNISARDFLEAQQAYTQSLSAVAQQHIGYILDRIEFFLDLEQMNVDQFNFWPQLRDEEYPFMANTDFGGVMPDGYGALPAGPWYSDCLRRMEQVPPGASTIWRSPEQP